MKKRWIGLLVENEIGVLARLTGLFSGKSYNLNSLTVGSTNDSSISRMTISLISDDKTFEQVKKQLNRSIEVIKVIDFTDIPIHRKELMFIKIHGCTDHDILEINRAANIFDLKIVDYDTCDVLLESVQTEQRNHDLLELLRKTVDAQMEIVCGGTVAIEAISISDSR